MARRNGKAVTFLDIVIAALAATQDGLRLAPLLQEGQCKTAHDADQQEDEDGRENGHQDNGRRAPTPSRRRAWKRAAERSQTQ